MRVQRVYQALSRMTVARSYCSKSGATPQAKKGSSESGGVNIGSVPGLTSKVLRVTDAEVGPGASKNSAYKNPEYYCYNPFSYAEAEVEMIKFRLPQPTNKA